MRNRFPGISLALLCFVAISKALLAQQSGSIAGIIADPSGARVSNAEIILHSGITGARDRTISSEEGCFGFRDLVPGTYEINITAQGLTDLAVITNVAPGPATIVELRLRSLSDRQQVTVQASDSDFTTADPSRATFLTSEMMESNPGRPGVPASTPGLPVETASGGIKAPQYFAPGVAGDHGEPIAQYFQIGSFLFPNNLPANAHGNGYADPNVLIASTIDGVTVDSGAFDVREGNNAVDLAASYVPKQRLTSFLQMSGDGHDGDVVAGWSPMDPTADGWLAAELSFGNGLLRRPEHRQQYKFNGFREFNSSNHSLTLLGMSYYGFSYVPGLIPVDTTVPEDTIDSRQLDHTYNFLAVASDDWRISGSQQLSISGLFRDYELTLRSDFGSGLIQQSETRNVEGGQFLYTLKSRSSISLIAAADLRRDAPRDLDLKHLNQQDVFSLVTSNNLTLSLAEPFISVMGSLGSHLHYEVGLRQVAAWINNQDLVNPHNSYDKLASITLPKATLSFIPGDRSWLPSAAMSFGEAFHTEDPRIGTGGVLPSPLASSRAYQLLFTKSVKQTRFVLALRRVSNSQELAKIDPDTGLQEGVGPSLNKVLSASLERHFSRGSLFVSYSQADARQNLTGQPVPEAPRSIWDAVISEDHLPLRLQSKGEFEYVKAKPLGDGFVGVPVREVRAAISRPFYENRMSLGASVSLPSGYTGQTTEVLAFPGTSSRSERVVGVPLRPSFGLTYTYYLGR